MQEYIFQVVKRSQKRKLHLLVPLLDVSMRIILKNKLTIAVIRIVVLQLKVKNHILLLKLLGRETMKMKNKAKTPLMKTILIC